MSDSLGPTLDNSRSRRNQCTCMCSAFIGHATCNATETFGVFPSDSNRPSIAGPERFGPGSPATITPATKKDIAVGSSAVRAGTARMTLHHKYLSSRREITTWTKLTTTCYALHNYSLKQWLHQCWALTPIALETKGGCPMSRRLHLTFILVRSKSEELWLGR